MDDNDTDYDDVKEAFDQKQRVDRLLRNHHARSTIHNTITKTEFADIADTKSLFTATEILILSLCIMASSRMQILSNLSTSWSFLVSAISMIFVVTNAAKFYWTGILSPSSFMVPLKRTATRVIIPTFVFVVVSYAVYTCLRTYDEFSFEPEIENDTFLESLLNWILFFMWIYFSAKCIKLFEELSFYFSAKGDASIRYERWDNDMRDYVKEGVNIARFRETEQKREERRRQFREGLDLNLDYADGRGARFITFRVMTFVAIGLLFTYARFQMWKNKCSYISYKKCFNMFESETKQKISETVSKHVQNRCANVDLETIAHGNSIMPEPKSIFEE